MKFCKAAFNAAFVLGAVVTTPLAAAPAERAVPHRKNIAASTLGDLGPYRGIASDTLKIVDKGDLAAARTRIRDLEKAWDAAEAGMKPKDRATWTTLDTSIDAALNALRDPAPRQADCANALRALLASIDGVGKA